ncbi:MAG: imidazoleglycerol-phosphate dehydratase HisB [Cocleimonas sp.]|nr:imidazoleglycerol-phosphate dehydratase HisB [Cocleimonas sp.]
MNERTATIQRDTLETKISATINLDGVGKARFRTDIPFLDHMLEQIAKHGLIDIELEATGDLDIDAHHTVEDIGITLGKAFNRAIGEKKGITRYGHAYVPLDEALSRVVIDFSGRAGLVHDIDYKRSHIGTFDTDLFHEFFQGFVNSAQVTLHIDNIRGRNAHHIVETIFKAFGRALRMAVAIDQRIGSSIPSTKGTLNS